LHITKEKSGNAAIKQLESKECDGPLSTVLNSWVQVNKFKLVNTSIKNTEQECEDLLQVITVSQKNTIYYKLFDYSVLF